MLTDSLPAMLEINFFKTIASTGIALSFCALASSVSCQMGLIRQFFSDVWCFHPSHG
jgi:hypothetical protein